MEDKAQCGTEIYWHNCYSGTFDLLSPPSTAHPAKMSPALCFRILQHLEELGLVKKGRDTILDPMSGTGMTNLCAGAMGYPSISVELEDKFVGFQKENKEYAERKLYKSLDWTMLQGDSRNLSSLLNEGGLKSVMSPPYQDSQGHPSLGSVNKDDWGKAGKDIVKRRGLSGEYGESEGQVGNLKSITSPPYMDAANPDHTADLEAKRLEIAKEKGISPDKVSHIDYTKAVKSEGYGEENGQIGRLKDKPLKSITSPPYGESIKGGKSGIDWQEDWGKPSENRQPSQDISYGESKENIGNLKDKPLKSIVSPPYGDAEKRDRSIEPHYEKEKDYPRGDKNIGSGYQGGDDNIGKLDDKPLKSVMSPPYEDSSNSDDPDKRGGLYKDPKRRNDKTLTSTYGNTEGQIGKEQSESYLSAMKTVYSEIALVSDCLTIVLKNPTRNGRIRRLDLDTLAILEESGWKVHCQHRALLFEELEQADMFAGSKKQVKGRLSFFKRLSWQKGQPVSSWEDIIVCTRK